MKIEYQIKFNQWKTDLLNRLEEHLISKPEPGFAVEHPEKLTDKLRVEVKEVPGHTGTYLVLRNGVKMGAFVDPDGLKAASQYANRIVNGDDTKQLPADGFYDRGQADLPPACKECGGRWIHLIACSHRPKQ